MLIVNSTLSGNSANALGGGVYVRANDNLTTIINSTVSNNTATINGVDIYGQTGYVKLRNSIVANSFGSGDCSVNFASVIANRQNIIDDGGCSTNAISVEPQIGPLADNGGPTLSHALLINSPAVSAGSDSVCTVSPVNSVDERGEPLANPGGTICDLGAFESPEGRTDSSFFVIPTPNGKMVVIEL